MTMNEYITSFESKFKWFDANFDSALARKKKQDMRKNHAYLPDDNPKKRALEIVFAKTGETQ